MATTNRWGRAIGAGVIAELVIIGSIILAMVLIKRVGPAAEGMAMAHRAATWIELIGGPIVLYFVTHWVVRPLSSFHIAHALVVVAIAVAGQLSIFSSTVAEGHAPLWIVASAVVLKIATAIMAAMLARRAAAAPPPLVSPS